MSAIFPGRAGLCRILLRPVQPHASLCMSTLMACMTKLISVTSTFMSPNPYEMRGIAHATATATAATRSHRRRQNSTVKSTVYKTSSVDNSRVVTHRVSSTVVTNGAPKPAPTSNTEVKDSGTNKGAVAGGVVGGVVGAALLALLAFLLWRRRRNSRTTRKLDEVFAESGVGGGGVDRRTRARAERDAWADPTYPPGTVSHATPVTSVVSIQQSPEAWQQQSIYQAPPRSSTDGLLASPSFSSFAAQNAQAAPEARPTAAPAPAPIPTPAAATSMPAPAPAVAPAVTAQATPAPSLGPKSAIVQESHQPSTPAPFTTQSNATPSGTVPSAYRSADGDDFIVSPSSEYMWLPRGATQEKFTDVFTNGPDSAHDEQEISNRLWQSTGTLRVANAE